MAKKWIKEAIKKPGSLRKQLGAKTKKGPRGGTVEEKIPAGKLKKAAEMKKKPGQKKFTKTQLKLKRRAVLAETLKKLPKRGRGKK